MELAVRRLFDPGQHTGRIVPEQLEIVPAIGLFAVADCDGTEQGRVAVRIALDAVRNQAELNGDLFYRFQKHPSDDLRTRILGVVGEMFSRAAQEVFAFGRRRGGILVTLDVVLVLETEAFVGHLGDGRVYLVRSGLVHQLTVDHSRGDDDIFEPFGNAPPVGGGPGEDRPVRALGPNPRVRVESLCMEVQEGDRLVIAGAVAYRAVPEEVLHHQLAAASLKKLGEAVGRLSGNTAPVLGIAVQLGGEAPSAALGAARLAVLEPMPLFAYCTQAQLRAVASATRPRHYEAGEVVFTEGDEGHEIFLIINGNLEVSKGGQQVAVLKPGNNFGEMSMLDQPQRSATVRAIEPAELLVISREAFFGLLRSDPPLAVKILWNLTLRLSANLRRTTAQLAEREVEPDGSAPPVRR